MKDYKSLYFVGAGGIGMAALERYFLAKGKKVAGYDRTPSELTQALEQEGVEIVYDENPDLIPSYCRDKDSTLVVYTPAVPSDHAGLCYFRDNGFEVVKRAKVLGIITPYWLGMGYYLYQGGIDRLTGHFASLAEFAPLADYSMLGEQQWVSLIWTVLLAFIGIVHNSRKGYQDKTRTRLLTQVFIVVDVLTIAFLLLQPQHYPLLMALIIVNTAPLVAHFITLTHTWLTNISFFIIIIITLAIIAYNLWTPSSNFLSATVMQVCSYLPL